MVETSYNESERLSLFFFFFRLFLVLLFLLSRIFFFFFIHSRVWRARNILSEELRSCFASLGWPTMNHYGAATL